MKRQIGSHISYGMEINNHSLGTTSVKERKQHVILVFHVHVYFFHRPFTFQPHLLQIKTTAHFGVRL